METNGIIIDPPRLDFAPGIGKTQEPKCIQTFLPDATIKRLAKGVVGRLSRSTKVERHTMHISPQIKVF